jgi:hypothetical protein
MQRVDAELTTVALWCFNVLNEWKEPFKDLFVVSSLVHSHLCLVYCTLWMLIHWFMSLFSLHSERWNITMQPSSIQRRLAACHFPRNIMYKARNNKKIFERFFSFKPRKVWTYYKEVIIIRISKKNRQATIYKTCI